MMRFTYQFDGNSPKIEVTLSPQASLLEAIEGFESFLHASGYCFDGVLDIIPIEDNSSEVRDQQ